MGSANINKKSKIFVAGHRGMVGSAIVRRLSSEGYENILVRDRRDLDLVDQAAVRAFMAAETPDYIFMAAAKVGGIQANNELRADFIYQNLMIETNIIQGAHAAGVTQGLFFGSSCIYPRDCPQPIREEYLLTGPLEETNEPYAIAKIAGVKMCEAYNAQYGTQYVSIMPTNLFGPNDNYDLHSSHVLPALIRKAIEARNRGAAEFVVWGTGTPRREFLHVNDLAEASVFVMGLALPGGLYNVGTGQDISIRDLAGLVARVVGFEGALVFDTSKPDGTPRKQLDVSRIQSLGWRAHTDLEAGIREAAKEYERRLLGMA